MHHRSDALSESKIWTDWLEAHRGVMSAGSGHSFSKPEIIVDVRIFWDIEGITQFSK
ncbi:uncharacterized protein PHALS_02469 [Plasmopara halstedii]|uniref:Uncharacterized protein n=1 Tax=Plasmopara halstedii TaxID=4781 RepID=A0A0P1A6Y3_PLAHL|nr:uncharacterized protein PHALS_02469 [Plasmopara halstedii]CEG36381.1 hypothetical protein PHALS_02469 [Plasmopara halstedii]|eukprot:XP_024572750.1 hypothetical protein PHALS_02469 [Plasmopara halstedii]